MKNRENEGAGAGHDAAIAAALVVMEEFFPHCPNGLAEAIHERLAEIIEDAIQAAEAVRWQARNEPSNN